MHKNFDRRLHTIQYGTMLPSTLYSHYSIHDDTLALFIAMSSIPFLEVVTTGKQGFVLLF